MRFGLFARALLRLAPLAAACAHGGPAVEPPRGDLSIGLLNEFSRTSLSPFTRGWARSWALVGAPSLAPERKAGDCCMSLAYASREDSLSRIGVVIEASRAFTADIRIYSNLGQFVDRVAFTIPPAQFSRLAPGTRRNTRTLRVLWDNRTADGALAGTGAYVLKTRVTLNPAPGETDEGTLTRIDYRVVALLRTL